MILLERVRPSIPKPACKVMLVCGPPAAGKTTYVREHACKGDIIIDVDTIAAELGFFSREQSEYQLERVLDVRNERLRALAHASPLATAWYIATAASRKLRDWWMDTLNADMILLNPGLAELKRRVMLTRSADWNRQYRIILQWYERERANDPGWVSPECDAQGVPRDPLHPWNLEPV